VSHEAVSSPVPVDGQEGPGANTVRLDTVASQREGQRLISLFLLQCKDYAVIALDPQGVVLAWLGGAQELLGYSAAEAVGMPLTRIFTLEDQRRGFDRHELEIARVDSRSEDDRWHVRKDGSRIWVAGTVTAVRDDHGTLLGFVKVMRDRTDVRTQIETLEAQAAAMNESRQRTHLFLNTLGHEFRNPLGPIKSATQIIRRLSQDSRIDDAAQIVQRQTALLTQLADDLTDIARLEAGKVALECKSVDLCELLRQTTSSLQKAASERGLTLKTVVPEGPFEVDMDEQRFTRLLLNLLGNAIKYTPSGGSIWVKATQEGNEAVVRVEDNGIGIDAEMLPRIFELFTQHREAANMAPGGLGIGLAMVREIAELHGGSVQVRSAGAGKGAEFTVRLPMRAATALNPPANPCTGSA
jgi:PAS domain S-box-containing protein